MINLLPPEDQIAAKKEYRRRLVIVVGIFLFSLISSAIILLAPSYFLLSPQKNNLETQFSATKELIAREGVEKTEASILALNQKLTILSSRENNQRQISHLLKRFSDIKQPAVKLTAFSYEKNGNRELFSIEGIASTRNSFLDFLNSVEKMEEVKKVSSPPSNLLKGENISFKLAIELSPQE